MTPGGGDDVVAATAQIQIKGRPLGSGVLVDERHLLTVEHIFSVGSTELHTGAIPGDVRVLFPHLHGDPIDASTLVVPDAAAVDLAILELADRNVRVRPVRLWAGQRLPQVVAVFGYPLAEKTPNGVWRNFLVSGPTTGGLRQLAWDEAVGSFPGHSGGPVVDPVSGALVGLLVSGSEEGRFDRFLPVTVIDSVWQGLRRPWVYAGEDARRQVRQQATGQRGHTTGWDLFKGQNAALQAIDRWVSTSPSTGRPLVITGQPGAGKSSVLARAVVKHETTSEHPGVVVNARSATATVLLDAVASAVDAPTAAAHHLSDLLDYLDDAANLPRRLLVMVDALDEAVNAEQRTLITAAVAELATYPWITIVVATRPLSTDNRFRPGGLLRQLGVTDANSVLLIELDSDRFWDPQSLRELTVALLVQEGATRPGPQGCAWTTYRSEPVLTSRLARVVAARAGRSFLVAALTAAALSASEDSIDPASPGFDATSLPTSVGEAIDKYLVTLQDTERARVRGMLRALAYARGPGITDQLWLRFIKALGYSADRSSLDALRDSAAVDYLVQTTTENEEAVSRLFHQALVEQLLATNSSRSDCRDIFASLLYLVQEAGGWSAAPTYPLVYAAEHAIDAGQLPALLDDTAFVLHADLDRLTAAASTLSPAERTPIAALILRHGAKAARVPPEGRAFFLAMSASHLGMSGLRDKFLADMPGFLLPRWAHGLGSPHQLLHTHTRSVRAVAIGRLGDRDVIVAGGEEAVRVWDSATNSIGGLLTGHVGDVRAVAVGRLADQDVIVVGGGDGAVRIWDSAGSPVGNPLIGHTRWVNAVAVGRMGKQDVIVSGGGDGAVRIWDSSGQPLGQPLTGHGNLVYGVAVGRLGERDVVVSGGGDGAVRIWDSSGRPIGEPLTGHTGAVYAVAIGRTSNQDLIVSAGEDRTARIWDSAHQPVGDPLTGHSRAVNALVIGRVSDRDVIVSGGSDGTVRIWDSVTQSVGEPLIGHTRAVRAVAVGRLAGRKVVVSGGEDRLVRMWNDAGKPLGDPQPGHASWVNAVAVGRLAGREVVVSGGFDNTVRIWDSAGQPIGNPLTGHTNWVYCVAVGQLGDQHVVVSGGFDNTLRIWNASGHQLGDSLTGHAGTVHAVALGPLNRQDVIVSGSEDTTLRIWNRFGHQRGNPLTGHLGAVRAVALGRLNNQDVIVSGSEDGTVRVWDGAGNQLSDPLIGHVGAVETVALGLLQGEDVIVSGASDSTLRIWDSAGHQIGHPLYFEEHCAAIALLSGSLAVASGRAVAVLHDRVVIKSASDV